MNLIKTRVSFDLGHKQISIPKRKFKKIRIKMMPREIFFWTLVSMCWIHVCSQNVKICENAEELDEQIKTLDQNVPVFIQFMKYTTPEKTVWKEPLNALVEKYRAKSFMAYEYESGENTFFKDITPPLLILRKNGIDHRFTTFCYDDLSRLLQEGSSIDKRTDGASYKQNPKASSGNVSTTTSSSNTAATDQDIDGQARKLQRLNQISSIPRNGNAETFKPAVSPQDIKICENAEDLDEQIKTLDQNVPVFIQFMKYTSTEKAFWKDHINILVEKYRAKSFMAYEYEKGANTFFKNITPPLLIFRKNGIDHRFTEFSYNDLLPLLEEGSSIDKRTDGGSYTENPKVSSGNVSTTTSSSTSAAPGQVSSQDLPNETTTTNSFVIDQYGFKAFYNTKSLDDMIKITDEKNQPVIIIFYTHTSAERCIWGLFLKFVHGYYGRRLEIFVAYDYELGEGITTFKDISPPVIIFRKDGYDIRYKEIDNDALQAILYIWFNEFHEYYGFNWPYLDKIVENDQVCFEPHKPRKTAITSTTTETTNSTPSSKETQYSFEIIDDKQTLENKIKTAEDEKVPVIVVFFKPDSEDRFNWEHLFRKVIQNYKGLNIFEALVNGENGIGTTYNISSFPAIIFRKDGHENRFDKLVFNHVQAMLYIWFSKVCYYEGYSSPKLKEGSSIEGRTEGGSSIGYETDTKSGNIDSQKRKKVRLGKKIRRTATAIHRWSSLLQRSSTSDALDQTEEDYSNNSKYSEYSRNSESRRSNNYADSAQDQQERKKRKSRQFLDNLADTYKGPDKGQKRQKKLAGGSSYGGLSE